MAKPAASPNVTAVTRAQAAPPPARRRGADFLILGDLNSYTKEDPIDAIVDGPDDVAGTGDDYANLVTAYQGRYAYSFVFDAQAGSLDHALANASLASQATGAATWHINAVKDGSVHNANIQFK